MLLRAWIFFGCSWLAANLWGQDVTFDIKVRMMDSSEPFDHSTITVQKVLPLTQSGFNLALQGQTEVLSDGSIAYLNGSAFVTNHHMGLGFTVDSITGNESTADLTLLFKTTDTWFLNPRSSNSVLPAGLGLKANFFIDAKVIYTTSYGSADESLGSPSSFEVSTGVDLKKISLPDTIFWNGGTMDVNQTLGAKWSNAGQMNGGVSLLWGASLFLGPKSRYEFDGKRSFVLQSVVFDDGTTPEEHGFDLVFGSGRPSPNLEIVVPEPSQGLILLLLACVMVCANYRHRNQHARCEVT